MTLFLWILQILLALVMLAAGGGKLAQPYAKGPPRPCPGPGASARRSRASRRGRRSSGPLGLDLPATPESPGPHTARTTGLALVMRGAVATHAQDEEWSRTSPSTSCC